MGVAPLGVISPGNLWEVRSKGVAGVEEGTISALVCTDAPEDRRSGLNMGPGR